MELMAQMAWWGKNDRTKDAMEPEDKMQVEADSHVNSAMQVMHMDGGNGKENVASGGGDSVTDEGAANNKGTRRTYKKKPRPTTESGDRVKSAKVVSGKRGLEEDVEMETGGGKKGKLDVVEKMVGDLAQMKAGLPE